MKKWTFFSWNRDNHKAFANAVASELENKANLDSPELTGTPTAPTPPPGTNNDQIATTKFAADMADQKVPIDGGTMTGVLIMDVPSGDAGLMFPILIKGRYNDKDPKYIWRFGMNTISGILNLMGPNDEWVGISKYLGLFSINPNLSLGHSNYPWQTIFVHNINNGGKIEIPEKAGTMALVSDIEDILRKHGLIPAEPTEETTETEGETNAQ